jgi:hypothetical protein
MVYVNKTPHDLDHPPPAQFQASRRCVLLGAWCSISILQTLIARVSA